MKIPLASITIPTRLRHDYGGVEFERLKESLTEYGQIQSLLLTPDNVLVAGGRRYAAMKQLNWTEAECIVGPPSERDRLLEIELEENVRRLNMSWQERCLAIALIHKMKKDKDTKWGLRETGELLNTSFAHLSKLVKVADRLRLQGDKRDEEMWALPDLNSALGLLLKRKETKAANRLSEMERDKREATAKSLGLVGKPTSVDDIDKLIADNTPDGEAAEALVNLSAYYHCEDFRTHLPRLGPESFDHVVTDIPYGIDMRNLERLVVDLDTVADQHDVEDNKALMPVFLAETYRVLRTGGFCIFWYEGFRQLRINFPTR